MVIFLLWLLLISCGIASGYIYDHVEIPQSYYYIVVSVAVVTLILHRVYTRKWHKPTTEMDVRHPLLFGGSAIVSFVVGLSSLFAVHTGEVSWGFFIGCLSVFILLCLAATREIHYV